MSTVLVVGARGLVGGALVPLLAATGHQVRRATSRPPTAPDQVMLDVVGGAGRREALAGAEAVFLMAPPGHLGQDQFLIPFIDDARAQGVRKLVLMTAMGADTDESSPMRLAERHLERSGLAWNVLRPNWFMQNFHTFWHQPIVASGQIILPTGTAKGSFIDARDIAAVAAVLLGTATHDGGAFDLTGAEALDHAEVAALLSSATGRVITYVDVPAEALRGPLQAAGLPADYVEFLLMILDAFKRGASARITDAVSTITGVPPRRFAAYAAEHAPLWAAGG